MKGENWLLEKINKRQNRGRGLNRKEYLQRPQGRLLSMYCLSFNDPYTDLSNIVMAS